MDGALLPILQAPQDEFGYIDEAAEPLIAAALNRSRAEIHGVVTFYQRAYFSVIVFMPKKQMLKCN